MIGLLIARRSATRRALMAVSPLLQVTVGSGLLRAAPPVLQLAVLLVFWAGLTVAVDVVVAGMRHMWQSRRGRPLTSSVAPSEVVFALAMLGAGTALAMVGFLVEETP